MSKNKNNNSSICLLLFVFLCHITNTSCDSSRTGSTSCGEISLRFSNLIVLESHIQCCFKKLNTDDDESQNHNDNHNHHWFLSRIRMRGGNLESSPDSIMEQQDSSEHKNANNEEEEESDTTLHLDDSTSKKDDDDYDDDSLSFSNSTNVIDSKSTSKKRLSWKLSNWTSEATNKAKQRFLDKIAIVSSMLLRSDESADSTIQNDDEEKFFHDDDQITHQSDLMRPGRKIFIVTTATIPWFTGTAVNPLLRAAYLNKFVKDINQNTTLSNNNNNTSVPSLLFNDTSTLDQQNDLDTNHDTHNDYRVTLVIPWLELEEDRLELYGESNLFQSPQEQEQYIREWMRNEANLPEEADPITGIRILFYPARYHSGLKSIFAMGDICYLIPDDEADVCILEEPEHLNWYRAPGEGWTQKFNFVVGIVHTNYKEYASAHYSGLWTAPAIGVMSSAMVRAYCHTVIKLSGTLQTFAEEKEKISNVHGVRSDFLMEGQRRSAATIAARNNHTTTTTTTTTEDEEEDTISTNSNNNKVYFIGKILWTKGLEKMLDLQEFYKQCTGDYFPIDIYGNGPELKEIIRAYHGRKRHRKSSRSESSKHKNMKLSTPETSKPIQSSDIESDDDDNNNDLPNTDSSTSTSDTASMNSESETESEVESDGNQLDEFITYLTALEDKTSRAKTALATHITKISSTIQKATKEVDDLVPKSLHELRRTPIPATFPGRVDHAILKEEYKIFVNPSKSEVLCTTTAEALAMGKFAIIPVHPSNDFFMQFPNCLSYRNKWEFVANLKWALTHEPEPLTEEQQRIFTWTAATERLVEQSTITRREARNRQQLGKTKLDERIAWFHNEMSKGYKGDTIRKVLGGGPIADQVKYEMAKRGEYEEGEDEGLSQKFLKSSLARAIRKTFAKRSSMAPDGAT